MDFREAHVNIAVTGMWHLGPVVAGCLASVGYNVQGFDSNSEIIDMLNREELPVNEPGLKELIWKGTMKGLLRFTSNPEDIAQSSLVWVTYDTPIDEEDRADTGFVVDSVKALFPHLKEGVLVIVSSQLPIGSTARLEQEFLKSRPDVKASFAYLPENLRLGNAIELFTNPERIIAGIRTEEDKTRIAKLLTPFTTNIIWMSVESAEMTKHAINAFLAISVSFINELSSICEHYGADALEVERGLKSDIRIGTRAYLRPGSAFAGGTLSRDLKYLLSYGHEKELPMPLFAGVVESNELHKNWPRRKLFDLLGNLSGKKLAILGLTYKPGTNTLRRSEAIETGLWLSNHGAHVTAYDPAVKELPAKVGDIIQLCASPEDALRRAGAALICTPWPEFRYLKAKDILLWMAQPVVLDPARFLSENFENESGIIYLSVGKPYES